MRTVTLTLTLTRCRVRTVLLDAERARLLSKLEELLTLPPTSPDLVRVRLRVRVRVRVRVRCCPFRRAAGTT